VKEQIRRYALELGLDDVGFAAASNYISPNSPPLESIFPGAKSLVIMALQELDNCESGNMQIAFGGRMDIMEFGRTCNYKMARFIQRAFGAKVMTIPLSYPLEMSFKTKGCIGDVSLRHAAVAAGLGQFGRNNLVLHPRLGSRTVFAGLITDLDLASDPQAEEICTNCNLCVEKCPGNALEDEGKTNLMRCLKNSQPYGIAANIRFWTQLLESPPEEQKKMIADEHFWKLFQAGFIGFQYFCFNCMKNCPVGNSSFSPNDPRSS
jgi:epoxyqueuosine reductase QueG